MIPYKFVIADHAFDDLTSLPKKKMRAVRQWLGRAVLTPHVVANGEVTMDGRTRYFSYVGNLRLWYELDDPVKEIRLLEIERATRRYR